jgi:hypothetical protein
MIGGEVARAPVAEEATMMTSAQLTTALLIAAAAALADGPAPSPSPAAPAAKPSAATSRPAPQRPKGKVTLPAKMGAVTFDHEAHAGKQKIACTTCHHPSRSPKPLAAEQQACRECHTMPAAPPMKTSLQAAFHNPTAGKGTCIDCHRKQAAAAKAPVKCLECHKKK